MSQTAVAWQSELVSAALKRTEQHVTYDGGYRSIGYPGGDVPSHLGVCTDLIVRSYRTLGLDLQKAVHEDMTQNFAQYPSEALWGLTRPDANIDHRRVPNLRRFFERQGAALAISQRPEDYKAGDVVTWRLPGNLPHIGIVSALKVNKVPATPPIIHNIGAGPEVSDMLFKYPITGHYRFDPAGINNTGGAR
ncbi:MAG: DUF1287 domain-containing protein [Lysobacterales bacterium]